MKSARTSLAAVLALCRLTHAFPGHGAAPSGDDQIPLFRPPGPADGNDASSLDSFVARQSDIAWEGLLCNVGPGDCVHGAGPGVVVASPDRVDPPYFFTWTRDSALVMKHVADVFIATGDKELERRIQHYAEAQARLQSVSNPSGSLRDGSGLGEAKFKVTLRPFLGAWGRPQRDGPALRAITMITYANHLVDEARSADVREFLWPIIHNDLSYVAQYWNDTGFDLWEEVRGSSFFTTAAQHRALTEGAELGRKLGLSCESCQAVAPHILCFLQSYWSDSKSYVVANVHAHDNQHRSGRDINTILSSIHNFDITLGCDSTTFQPCSDRALANHKAVTDSFRKAGLYPINDGIPRGAAIAVGRYPEDIYYDGNPWYLATLAAAEQLYDAIMTWRHRGCIPVTMVSLAFFRDLVPELTTGVYHAGSAAYGRIVTAVLDYADGFVDVVRNFTPVNGSLSEQFGRETGEPLSAHDLTWSYAAFLTAAARRAGIAPRPWATSPSATVLPPTCAATTVRGHYAAPTRTVFPGVPPPEQTRPCGDSTPPSEAPVAFREFVETGWGETIKMVGSVPELGEWDVDRAPSLDSSQYTADEPVWKIEVDLPVGKPVEYKFVRVDAGGRVIWERDPNHIVTASAGAPCSETATPTVEAEWQG